eukprot:gnl/Spiro4/4803_TR2404_c0_g1_i3.p3 gnl/Spiro4/4803_TR2404_c0_g1~~gnl/Spiro4/4803_TR2404_c0_g1_i3.p3  ORF type:complete len:238 (-),score=21.36 gnl/Spiro4/4803_TR2404_c0_g1_i3:4820-5533(-)
MSATQAYLNQLQAYNQLQGATTSSVTAATLNNYATTSSTNYVTLTYSSAATTLSPSINVSQAIQAITHVMPNLQRRKDGDYELKATGKTQRIHLDDGSVLEVDGKGNFKIIDKDAKVTYKANRVRDFNTFINASDKLEEFIKFCGVENVKQGEVLNLPLHLFIKWLVIEAAKADAEPEPDLPLLPDLRKVTTPKCRCCGKYLHRAKAIQGFNFCGPKCFSLAYTKRFGVQANLELSA